LNLLYVPTFEEFRRLFQILLAMYLTPRLPELVLTDDRLYANRLLFEYQTYIWTKQFYLQVEKTMVEVNRTKRNLESLQQQQLRQF